ncbi:LptF/LptG family permease [Shimia sagamensis]|uniref:Lipopolysaccharide export LptBFGC system, permease protein LptF n=1 Tax=Shimia sagamensis TaxID=1566352 RepID=A0ABY1N9B6_9RHOB|nr:LptF/LptG family permease [Shimia sagamensis]SMP03560.1 Lipopolysaccharide export LptBFGC system, permease protein LptF [Shimia sagamensis]
MSWRRHTGLAVRAMVRGDLAAIGFMMFVLLVVALTIDLANWLDTVRARAEATGNSLWQVLFPYIGYRTTDITTRLLTMACVAGGFVVTLLRHQRLDDVVLSAAGASPSLRLTALMISGLLLGTVQMVGENWLRPAAVQAQVAANLGDYGNRYFKTDVGTQWMFSDTRALRATVTRGPEAALSDVMLFEAANWPDITHILHAQTASPSFRSGIWTLTNVTTWNVAANTPPTFEPQVDMPLAVTLDKLRWFGVDGYYLPNDAARAIVAAEATPAAPTAEDAATALAVRKVALFLPGIFAFLGVSLASLGTQDRRLSPFKLLALATVGYLSVVSVKVFWALGIHGVLPPMLAASLPALFALCLCALLQLHQAGYLPAPRRAARSRP